MAQPRYSSRLCTSVLAGLQQQPGELGAAQGFAFSSSVSAVGIGYKDRVLGSYPYLYLYLRAATRMASLGIRTTPLPSENCPAAFAIAAHASLCFSSG